MRARRFVVSRRFALAVSASLALSAVSRAHAAVPTGWSQEAAIDGGTTGVGASIAVTDTLAIVGAPFAPATSGGTPTGAVFVYSNAGAAGGPSISQTLTAPSPINGGNFGTSVATSGNLVAVGATGTPPAAYVFAADAGAYESAQTFADPASDQNGTFGQGVAVFAGPNGVNDVAVAAVGGSTNPNGIVYVSRQVDGGAWSNPPLAITNAAATAFGFAVAFAGNGKLLVGDPGTGAGQVLVYGSEADGGWTNEGTIPFSFDGGSVQQFGYALATWSNLAVVVAPETADDAGTYNGIAFVFASDDAGVWTQQAVLKAGPTETFAGFTPAITGAFIAVGSQINTQSSGVGLVDVWAATGGVWVPVPSTALAGDSYYGQAVGLVGQTLFIGDTSGLAAGSVDEAISSLFIETAIDGDGGAALDAAANGGGADGSALGGDGSTPAGSDAATSGDGASGEGTPASSSGCSCTSATAGGGGGALAMVGSALAFLACARRRRSRT